MSVLTLLVKTRIPLLSLLLIIALVASFISFETQDATTLQKVTNQYKQHGLLQLEKPIYVEFIERRFNIEQIGTADYLRLMQDAAQEKNPDTFISLLLNDRFFYPYLLNEGRLFFSEPEFKSWRVKREEQVNPLVRQLSELRFALSSERYSISTFISYVFVESSRLWLMVNLIILLVCGVFIEPKIGRSKVLLLFLGGAFSTASIYLLVLTEFSFILQGASGALCALMGASLSQIFLSYRETYSLKLNFALFVLFASIVGLYLSAQLYFGKSDVNGLMAYFMSLVTGGGFYIILRRLTLSERLTQIALATESNSQTDRQFRSEFAGVMNTISAFDFDSAREKLKLMSEHYPDSADVKVQRYHLEKLHSGEGVYWECVRDLVNYSVVKKDYARMKFIFADIQKNAPSKQRAKNSLEPEFYHKMMMVFVKFDDLNKAEQAFLFLELAGQKDIIRDACQLLIQEFKSRGVSVKQQQYQMLFERIG